MVHLNIEKIRLAKGKTKTFLANKLGLSLQGYRHIANGDTKIDVDRLMTIASALEVKTNVLLDDKLTESVINSLNGKKEAQLL